MFDYYRGLVVGSDSTYVGYSEQTLKKTVLREARALAGERVTELGCGPNPVVPIALALDGRQVTCVELSASFAEAAAQNARRAGADIRVLNAPAHATTLPSESAEIVILTEVLEHVPDEFELATLREARRLLVPGGHLVISVPNAGSALHRYQDWRNGAKAANEEHLREYTVVGLRSRLGDAGLMPVKPVWVPSTDQPFIRHKSAWVIDRIARRPRWASKAMFIAARSL